MEHDLEKLLGGFAADTLTDEERKLLYTAALQNQELFNALADEQALKELLADPDVRRRLLASLGQKNPAGTGGSLSWLDWFRRPAGLAFAGGLAAAALAVVLGIRIYQDSLRQAASSVATEEAKLVTPPTPAPSASQPASPATPESQPRAKDNVLADKMGKRERSAPPAPQTQRASESVRDSLKQQRERDEVRKHAEAPVAALSKTAEEATLSADQKLATSSAPPAAVPPPALMQAPASAPAAGAVAPAVSARALFYKTVTEPAAEQERRLQPATAEDNVDAGRMAEAPLSEKKRAERSIGVLGKLESAKQSVERPLGIRYSLIMAGPGGIDMEVDPATSVRKDDASRLAVQTNEDGYLFILYARQSSDQPTVLFPASGDGRVAGRKTVAIALGKVFNVLDVQQTTEQIRLLIMFSRTPRDMNSALASNKNVSRLLIEQVAPGQPGAPAEQAVYVVNRDPSLTQLLVEIPLSLH